MGNGKIIKLGFILIIIVSLFISFACQSGEDDVEIGYEVTVSKGDPCLVDITYSDAGGRIVQVFDQDIPVLPFDISFSVPGDEVTDFLVFLTAQNCSNAALLDAITVTIRRDGLLFLDDIGFGPSTSVSIIGNL